ncbi:hypothetical protein ScalyP_jg648 [Parmales sp. scaly parma]|nr:hypothetical protein ScalyP_jg648 [Parmales sp. scaly parma]|tara:strand:+ start:200 stop:691 length:492 start_codon:yes stop_codon:yes gene_type:complete
MESKAESKFCEENEVKFEASESKSNKSIITAIPTFTLHTIDISPETGAITDGIELEMEFSLSCPVSDAFWEIKYVVDSMSRRQIIILGETDKTNYPQGESSMLFSVQQIDVSNVKQGTLANAGLLSATLIMASTQTEVITINAVVQVTEEEGEFNRVIYNPLE